MRFIHMATAYILRWNKRDYTEIIGVFLTQDALDKFMQEHFTPEEILSTDLKVEHGRYYEKG